MNYLAKKPFSGVKINTAIQHTALHNTHQMQHASNIANGLMKLTPALEASRFAVKNIAAPSKALQTLISNPIFLETAKFDFSGHARLLEKTFSHSRVNLDKCMPGIITALNVYKLNALEATTAQALQSAGVSTKMIAPSLQIADSLSKFVSFEAEKLRSLDTTLAISPALKTFSDLIAKQQKYIQKDVLEYNKRLKVIELATNMMQEHLHSVCTYAEESDVSELEIPTEIESTKTAVQYVPVYLGYALANDSNYDLDEEFAKSMPSIIIQCGKNIAEKIVYINEVCASKGIDEIFKPTTRSLTSISQLTTAFAVDSNTFGTVTDSLYFLLYEGSGKAKRILDFLSDEECYHLWNIKHLRTDFRHDVEHGKSSDIKKKKIAIGKAYHEICGMLRPLKQKDWVKAHHNLFIKTDAFLDLLISKLNIEESEN